MKKRLFLLVLSVLLVAAIAVGCRPVERPVPEQQRQVVPAPGEPVPGGGGRMPTAPGPEEDLLPGRRMPETPGTPGGRLPDDAGRQPGQPVSPAPGTPGAAAPVR